MNQFQTMQFLDRWKKDWKMYFAFKKETKREFPYLIYDTL